ncbi:hypothetical protein QFC19_004935 [Naganishia cerealis]|uniref:Uncharacterized protein n=1 Tax=Naganishia cerealis TaxID=610337 RepID=A0ACC2VRE9_9TREE|nr:hypothetical protein QFC19_004935 [Naganishia cerealis]
MSEGSKNTRFPLCVKLSDLVDHSQRASLKLQRTNLSEQTKHCPSAGPSVSPQAHQVSPDAITLLEKCRRRGECLLAGQSQADLHPAVSHRDRTEAHSLMPLIPLHMRREAWSDAKEVALQVLKLLPFSESTLFQLSVCYERLEDFGNAYTSYARGVCLIPEEERGFYWSKLFRLKEQLDDQKVRLTSTDPFDILPLELLVEIMEFGLASDSKFVWQSSWVNQKWRKSLTENCRSLWKKVELSRGVTIKQPAEKWQYEIAQTYIKRSNGNLDTMKIQGFDKPGINRLWKFSQDHAWTAKTLHLGLTGLKALEVVQTKFKENVLNVQNLVIHCGPVRANEPPNLLVCLDSVIPQKLKTLEVVGVNFRMRLVESLMSANDPRIHQNCDSIIQYPSLKRLKVHGCAFDNSYAPSVLGLLTAYQVDQLHSALRGAPALESLEVTYLALGEHMAPFGVGKRIVLMHLRKLVLPSPSIWCIDVFAPNLESLSYIVVGAEWTAWCLPLVRKHHLTLIPGVDEAPTTFETLSRLKHVEFFCYEYDLVSRLEEWLSRLKGVTKLKIVAAKVGKPWPNQENQGESLDTRARMHVLQLLIDHPEWCPNLEDLELHACFASGSKLVEFVRTRRCLPGCATIRRLVLEGNMCLTERATMVLSRGVQEFSISLDRESSYLATLGSFRKQCEKTQYMRDDFGFDPSSEMKPDQSMGTEVDTCMAHRLNLDWKDLLLERAV